LQRTFPTGLGIDGERPPGGARQILIERTGDAILDHVDGPGHGVGGHRHPAGHGLQVHQTERIGAAREYHDVGRRQVVGEIFAEAIAGEHGVAKLLFETRTFGSVAYHDLAARPGHAEESPDILLHRNAPDVSRNGPRHIQKFFGAGFEEFGVHAALPDRQVGESMCGEFLAQ